MRGDGLEASLNDLCFYHPTHRRAQRIKDRLDHQAIILGRSPPARQAIF
jgi:hypothetical protein